MYLRSARDAATQVAEELTEALDWVPRLDVGAHGGEHACSEAVRTGRPMEGVVNDAWDVEPAHRVQYSRDSLFNRVGWERAAVGVARVTVRRGRRRGEELLACRRGDGSLVSKDALAGGSGGHAGEADSGEHDELDPSHQSVELVPEVDVPAEQFLDRD